MKIVWRVSGRCLAGVLWLSGGCLNGVWNVKDKSSKDRSSQDRSSQYRSSQDRSSQDRTSRVRTRQDRSNSGQMQ